MGRRRITKRVKRLTAIAELRARYRTLVVRRTSFSSHWRVLGAILEAEAKRMRAMG